MKSKALIWFFILCFVVIIGYCISNIQPKYYEVKHKNVMGSTGENWEFECIPNTSIELVEKEDLGFILSPGHDELWKFEIIKPGKCTLCWIKYKSGSSLSLTDSYAQDYIVKDNLEIEKIGEPYPIWKVEGCKAVSDYIERISTNLSYMLTDYYNEFDGVTYEVSYDTDLKKFYVIAYNTNFNGDDIKQFAYDFTVETLHQQGKIFDEYEVEVTVVDRDDDSTTIE
jgi:hypothetical protein